MTDFEIRQIAQEIYALAGSLDCTPGLILYRLHIMLPNKLEYSSNNGNLTVKTIPLNEQIMSTKDVERVLAETKYIGELS